jgi:hypothetical protein
MASNWQAWHMVRKRKIRVNPLTKAKAKALKPLVINEFQRDIATIILDLVASGNSMEKACKKAGITSGSFRAWCLADALLAGELSRARELQAAFLAEQTVEIADSNRDPAKVRNMLAARQWLAGKHNKHYSDKLTIDANVKHEHYLEQLDLPPHMKAHMLNVTPERAPSAQLTAQGNLVSEGRGSENIQAGGEAPICAAGPGGESPIPIPDQFSKSFSPAQTPENNFSPTQTATQESSV